MTITEFLLERIAEDEAAVAVFPGRHWRHDYGDVRDDSGSGFDAIVLEIGYEGCSQIGITEHIARHDPARVLAECTAKRAIIDAYELYVAYSLEDRRKAEDRDCMWNYALTVRESLKALASVYADHPDYQPEWTL